MEPMYLPNCPGDDRIPLLVCRGRASILPRLGCWANALPRQGDGSTHETAAHGKEPWHRRDKMSDQIASW